MFEVHKEKILKSLSLFEISGNRMNFLERVCLHRTGRRLPSLIPITLHDGNLTHLQNGKNGTGVNCYCAVSEKVEVRIPVLMRSARLTFRLHKKLN